MKRTYILFCLLFAITSNFITPAAKAQAVNANDSLALVDFYNSTNGPHWRNHTYWLTTAPVGAWYGVTVENNRVTGIKLQFNFLSGPLPASIGNLTNLNSLDLFSNGLSDSIPSSIGNLTNLTYLDLTTDGTKYLVGTIPTSIGNLINLNTLVLQNNHLTGGIPTSIGNLINLSYMDLHGNRLNSPLPSAMGSMVNLAYLDLSLNNINGSIPFSFGSITYLSQVSLKGNRLSGSIPASLGNLKYLYSLELTGNKLTGSIPRSFINLISLRSLLLANNRLTQDKNVDLPIRMQPYTLVDITNNYFTFNGLEFLAKKFPQSYYNDQARVAIHQQGNTLSVDAGGTLSNNTYHWFKAGTIADATIQGDSTFTPSTSGSYYAQVTNALATQLTIYTDTIDYIMPMLQAEGLIVNATTTKPLNSSHPFSIYPNPATNIIHIQTNGTAIIIITNSSGKTLLTKTINNTAAINVSQFANGTYYIQNKTTGEVQKIIVVH